MAKKVKPELPTELKELELAFDGDTDLLLFYVTWLKHGLDAQAAYQELHPDVTKGSAGVLGSRMLKKVRRDMILQAYGLDINSYLVQLREGMQATRPIGATILIDDKGKLVRKEDEGVIQVPDHLTRRFYHDKLGRLLGIEGKDIPSQFNQQNNFYEVKDEELTAIVDKTGSMELGEEELAEALVDGNIPREDEMGTVEIHSQELPDENSAN